MKNRKVLLVYPRTGLDPLIPQPPYSVLTLVPNLLKEGYEPLIIDQRVEPDWKGIIDKNIDGCLGIGISTMTGFQIKHALDIAEYIKQKKPDMPIIFGGVHPTFLPKQTINNPNIDIVIKGYGEKMLPEVIKRIEKGQSLSGLDNVIDKKSEASDNDDYKIDIIDENERIRWKSIDVNKYIRPDFGLKKTIALITSRGCPHRCNFCYNNSFNKRLWKGKDPKIVIEEIKYLKENFGIQGIDFTEDNFFVNPNRVKEICELMIKENLNIKWSSSARVDYFSRYDEKFLELLKESGCVRIFFGVESGSERILKLIQKDITVEQVISTVTKLKNAGIAPHFTFMAGFPTETKEDIMKTIDLIDRIKKLNHNAVIGGLFSYMAFPNTELYEIAVKNGFKPPETLEEWGGHTFFTANKKLDWFSRKDKRFLETISFIARFVFYDKTVKRGLKNIFEKIAFDCLRFMGKIRWRLRFFSFPVEWMLLSKYYNWSSKKY